MYYYYYFDCAWVCHMSLCVCMYPCPCVCVWVCMSMEAKRRYQISQSQKILSCLMLKTKTRSSGTVVRSLEGWATSLSSASRFLKQTTTCGMMWSLWNPEPLQTAVYLACLISCEKRENPSEEKEVDIWVIQRFIQIQLCIGEIEIWDITQEMEEMELRTLYEDYHSSVWSKHIILPRNWLAFLKSVKGIWLAHRLLPLVGLQ